MSDAGSVRLRFESGRTVDVSLASVDPQGAAARAIALLDANPAEDTQEIALDVIQLAALLLSRPTNARAGRPGVLRHVIRDPETGLITSMIDENVHLMNGHAPGVLEGG